jgi:hypothetical protein
MFFQLIKFSVVKLCGRDSSVGVATRYRVEGPPKSKPTVVFETPKGKVAGAVFE